MTSTAVIIGILLGLAIGVGALLVIRRSYNRPDDDRAERRFLRNKNRPGRPEPGAGPEKPRDPRGGSY